MTPHTLIAMPTAQSVVHVRTLNSLIDTCHVLAQRRLAFFFHFHDSADIVTARNSIAATFLRLAQCTHLLFVDNDMEFKGATVGKLLDADKDVIGCVYPKRALDRARLEAVFENISRRPEGVRPGVSMRNVMGIAAKYGKRRACPMTARA